MNTTPSKKSLFWTNQNKNIDSFSAAVESTVQDRALNDDFNTKNNGSPDDSPESNNDGSRSHSSPGPTTQNRAFTTLPSIFARRNRNAAINIETTSPIQSDMSDKQADGKENKPQDGTEPKKARMTLKKALKLLIAKRPQLKENVVSPSLLKEYKYRRGPTLAPAKKTDGIMSSISNPKLSDVAMSHFIKSNLAKVGDEEVNKIISQAHHDTFSDEEEYDEARLKRISRMKKSFYVVYFIGLMLSLRNRVKLLGAYKPIDDINDLEKEKLFIQHKSFLPLLPTRNISLLWTLIIAMLIIFTAILTPYRVSFIEDGNQTFEIIEIIFDVGFGIDIIVNFISAYYDPRYGLITDFKSIAKNYLKGWFWVDIVAIFPFDTVIGAFSGNSTNNKYNKLLRLLRFPRLYRLLKILRLFKMVKLFSTNHSYNRMLKKLNLNLGLIKMANVLVTLIFWNHLIGCLWFFIARLDDFNPDTWVSRYDLIDDEAWTQYVASFYWAFQTLTTVGYGDIVPKTAMEQIIAVSWMMVGVGFYSFTIGNLSSILETLDRRSQALKNKLTAFNNFAMKVKLPVFLRQKVQRYFEYSYS